MPTYLTFSATDLPPLDAASHAELQALAAEAMGWQPLDQGTYLHEGDQHAKVIQVVGIPQPSMADSSLLWLV